jgi:hypothetical protein
MDSGMELPSPAASAHALTSTTTTAHALALPTAKTALGLNRCSIFTLFFTIQMNYLSGAGYCRLFEAVRTAILYTGLSVAHFNSVRAYVYAYTAPNTTISVYACHLHTFCFCIIKFIIWVPPPNPRIQVPNNIYLL